MEPRTEIPVIRNSESRLTDDRDFLPASGDASVVHRHRVVDDIQIGGRDEMSPALRSIQRPAPYPGRGTEIVEAAHRSDQRFEIRRKSNLAHVCEMIFSI